MQALFRDVEWSVANIWKMLRVYLITLISRCTYNLLLMPSDRDVTLASKAWWP